jgi:magnesium-transporting ATPase (P-type)
VICRADLEADEDASSFTPTALLKRKPSMVLVALMAILDPPRDEAIAAVKVAHQAGIVVKMITGERRGGAGGETNSCDWSTCA